MDCQFRCAGETPELEVLVATHLYRIAQEAATNAVRHSKATKVDISLERVADEVVLTVTDNGSGLPENFRKNGGHGLHLMEYRADLIGADFNIGRGAGGGRIFCRAAVAKSFSRDLRRGRVCRRVRSGLRAGAYAGRR